MNRRRANTIFFVALVLPALFSHGPASAQPGGPEAGRDKTVYSLSFTPVYQFDADLDRGGQFSVSRYVLGFDVFRPVAEGLQAGISILYDYEKYDFSGVTAFAGPGPWNEIHRFGLGLPLNYRFGQGWSVFFSPQVEYYGESGVGDWEDALNYGAAAGISCRLSPHLTVGAGAGVFHRAEEVRVFPFVTVDWRLSDNLRLSNPLRVSPAGPAGLELSYRLGARWEIGAGGAWRSLRFRLDDSGLAPGGVGEMESILGWGRLTYRANRVIRLDVYAGAAINGQMTIEDCNGNEIGSDDFETAPVAAVTLTAEF